MRYGQHRYACDDGHILYSDNVWITADGFVVCRACDQIDRERRVEARRLSNRMAQRRRRAS